jgi:hypothetical protein
MIINKSKHFSLIVRRIMLNLKEFEFSQVSKTISHPISNKNDKNKSV